MRLSIQAIAAGTLLLAAGCSGTSEKRTSDSDTTAGFSAEVPEPESQVWYLTPDSLGPVHVGMKTAEMPENWPGLYTEIQKERAYGTDAYNFLLDEDVDHDACYPFTVIDFGMGNVDIIMLNDSLVKVATPNGDISVNTPFSEVLALEGITPEWEEADGNGAWFWKWNGLWFQPAQEEMDQQLSSRLYDPNRRPVGLSFPPEIKTSLIATGLPF